MRLSVRDAGRPITGVSIRGRVSVHPWWSAQRRLAGLWTRDTGDVLHNWKPGAPCYLEEGVFFLLISASRRARHLSSRTTPLETKTFQFLAVLSHVVRRTGAGACYPAEVETRVQELQASKSKGQSVQSLACSRRLVCVSDMPQCDQGKPRCERCTSFGVMCNFSPCVPDLQPTRAASGWGLRQDAQPGAPVWTCDAAATPYRYRLNAKCQDFITRYLGRSLTTPDDPDMRRVNKRLLELAFAVSGSPARSQVSMPF